MKKRGAMLTVFAVLLTLLAISNLLKPLQLGDAGFVFLGTKTTGLANTILGPLFGIYLLIYVVGIWQMRKFALPMGVAYAAYVPLNMALFTMGHPQDPNHGWPGLIGGLVYMAVAIGVSWGAPIVLWSRRSELS